ERPWIFLGLRMRKLGKAPPQLTKFEFITVGRVPQVTEWRPILSAPCSTTLASGPASFRYSSSVTPEVVEPSLPDHSWEQEGLDCEAPTANPRAKKSAKPARPSAMTTELYSADLVGAISRSTPSRLAGPDAKVTPPPLPPPSPSRGDIHDSPLPAA